MGIVGRSPAVVELLERLEKIAGYEEPVLILGESGVGKEALAEAVYLLSPRRERPFVSVNCPQYVEGNLTVSELFGHKRGSFTGAHTDRKGAFETADGGVIFLDEIGDLHMSAQVILLRALANGTFQPLGSDVTRQADVRVVAATNRSLNELISRNRFRRDLLFRLRYFLLEVPALRERGDDWRLLVNHYLESLRRRYGIRKRLSPACERMLETYGWPGNVRELVSVVTAGYALADGEVVEPEHVANLLEEKQLRAEDREDPIEELSRKLTGSGDFWELVRDPFLARDLNRRQVRSLLKKGLRISGGSYRRLLDCWGLDQERYQKFMDFLRHHQLKPPGAGR